MTETGLSNLRHIVLVDEDPETQKIVKEYLAHEEFRVSLAADGDTFHEVLRREPVDLVILDLRLPDEDGLTLVAELRQNGQAGIIILSRKDDLVDKVTGLEVGADDYLTKPFHPRELLARVRSVLRRLKGKSATTSAPATAQPQSRFRFAGFELDRHKRLLVAPSGEPVNLSAGEFNLLIALAEHPKRALSREQILDQTCGREAALFDRSVDVQIGRLRRKIEANPRWPELIKTIRGVGYMFDTDVQQ